MPSRPSLAAVRAVAGPLHQQLLQEVEGDLGRRAGRSHVDEQPPRAAARETGHREHAVWVEPGVGLVTADPPVEVDVGHDEIVGIRLANEVDPGLLADLAVRPFAADQVARCDDLLRATRRCDAGDDPVRILREADERLAVLDLPAELTQEAAEDRRSRAAAG